jgi:PhnB protein
MVKPIPDGYHSITPYLMVKGAAAAIEFYKKAFRARERMRMPGPDGRIGHAELEMGDAAIMLADEFPEMDALGPQPGVKPPVGIHLYIEDVDATVERAVAAGAKLLRPVEDQFYGDRMGTIIDPFGHLWHVSTHKEDVPPDELRRRAEAAMKRKG